jgi:hypothetical protein
MKIVQLGTAMVAEPRKRDGRFVCGPKNSNLTSAEKTFHNVEIAAAFLCENPDWGIRMNPEWDLVFRNISIERDA